MIPSEGDGDIPSSPGHLLLIGEEISVESNNQDLGDMDQSGTIKLVPQARDCEVDARSPVPLASQILTQEPVGDHQVVLTPW